ncbi:hypothetical protein F1728_00055 [Gimesia benthica]|uniref:Uncharacterized protein n=1 Tax=Gimesia benthica TaxID=2608982 RepID=A0A6I6A6I9_9PLAN|nr:hypothetical protein [Gimesia benthica]QGQ21192.1 hypothetical protein F1728_00055 [Gimesia benthica]
MPERCAGESGQGISGTVNGHQLLIGTEALVTSEGCLISPAYQQSIADCRSQGLTTVLIAVDGNWRRSVASATACAPIRVPRWIT